MLSSWSPVTCNCLSSRIVPWHEIWKGNSSFWVISWHIRESSSSETSHVSHVFELFALALVLCLGKRSWISVLCTGTLLGILSWTWSITTRHWQLHHAQIERYLVWAERRRRIDLSHDLSSTGRWWLWNHLQGNSVDGQTQLICNAFEISFPFSSYLVYFQGCFDLLGSEPLSSTIFAIDTNAFLLFFPCLGVAAELISEHSWVLSHLSRKNSIFFYLLFCIPEPFVDLIFFKIQFFREPSNFITSRCLSVKPFI